MEKEPLFVEKELLGMEKESVIDLAFRGVDLLDMLGFGALKGAGRTGEEPPSLPPVLLRDSFRIFWKC